MLPDKFLNDEGLRDGIFQTAEVPAELEQAHDFAYVISFVVVVTIFGRYNEREGLVDTLDAHSEVQERHVQVEEFFETLIHAVMQVERVNQGKDLRGPSILV